MNKDNLIIKTHSIQASFFATPERRPIEEIDEIAEILQENDIVRQLLEGYPGLAFILNEHRQIVAFNEYSRAILHEDEDGKIVGQRLGEALRCINMDVMDAGCGTSKFCRVCGAARSMVDAIEHKQDSQEECRITLDIDNKNFFLDLGVKSTPFKLNGHNYVVFAVQDIADKKRKQVLEKVFFHDILNTATAIQSIAELLPTIKDTNEYLEFSDMLENSAVQLIQEIHTQRDLVYAENGKLSVNPVSTTYNTLLEKLSDLYSDHTLSKGKDLNFQFLENDIQIFTDQVFLVRSLGNILKNALEASKQGQSVYISCTYDNETVTFNVKNEGVIPEDIQLQIFQRSFSTKADSGRGIGTYSIKLFVEQYLQGKVSFISDEENQTLFTVEIPRSIQMDNCAVN